MWCIVLYDPLYCTVKWGYKVVVFATCRDWINSNDCNSEPMEMVLVTLAKIAC